MSSFLTQIILLAGTFLGLLYLRLARAISYVGGVPRVGKPGVIGYIRTALKWTLYPESVILEGREQFSNGPFVLPMLSGPVFFLPPKYMESVRAGPDSIFNEMMAVNEDLQLPFTMDQHQLNNPYQARVLRTSVNRAIPSYIPEILDESILAMIEAFQPQEGTGYATVPVFDTMTHLIARISNRVIFGSELCRDQDFLRSVVRFAETTPLMAPFIQWSPYVLRPVVYFILSSFLGGKKEALRFLMPHLKKYTEERKSMVEKLNLVSEHLIQSATPEEPLEGIAVRLLNINFGSIHTSSIFITQALFEIALLSAEDVDSMRIEVEEALDTEGGWTKAALDKFYKIDSALREIGRYYGLLYVALGRVAMVDFDLGDGTHVPAGYRVAIDMKAIHFNPKAYPDPDRCDLFRFSRMRRNDGDDAKLNFATVDSNYLPFGAGRHACAGRNFASMELKIMLAHMLIDYDITYPAGITERPKNADFNGAIIPDSDAHLVFTPRNRTKGPQSRI